mgnify:CR=1 FL=1
MIIFVCLYFYLGGGGSGVEEGEAMLVTSLFTFHYIITHIIVKFGNKKA